MTSMPPRLPPLALLAGGLATRMRPLTETIPKSLLEVAGKPFLDHQLALFAGQGVRHVVICAGHLGEQMQGFAGNGARWGLSIAWSFDGGQLLGTGGALMQALPLLGEEFIVTYGDSYLDEPFAPIVAAFRASEQPALMTVFRNEGRYDTSNIEFADDRLKRYDKVHRTPAMQHIDYGLQVLKREALAGWPEGRQFDLAAVYSSLVEQGRMAGYETGRRFHEIGSLQGLADLEVCLKGQT
jgi:NDP-sugar pyrophosphorylase family protein